MLASQRIRRLLGAALVCSIATGTVAAQQGGFRRVALLPLANASTDPQGALLVRPILEVGLRVKAFDVVDPEEVEEFLAGNRIRHTDSLDLVSLQQLRDTLRADYVMAGRLLGLRRSPVPDAGLTLRLVDTETGRIVWASVLGTSGGRYRRLFGLGIVDEPEYLVQLAVDEILKGLHAADLGTIDHAPKKIRDQSWAPDAIVYANRSAPWDSIRTVAVLPFLNETHRSAAEGIVRDVVVCRLWQSGWFEVIEPGEMREQLRRLGLFPYMVAGDEVLASLREELGIDAVLGGTVLNFRESPEGVAQVEPVIEVAMRLVSTQDGEILWTGVHTRRGWDGETLYESGRVLTSTELTRALVDDLLSTFPVPKRRKKR